MAARASGKAASSNRDSKPDVDRRASEPPAEATNRDHPTVPGALGTAPGAGIVEKDADVSTHHEGPGREAPQARSVAPGAKGLGQPRVVPPRQAGWRERGIGPHRSAVVAGADCLLATHRRHRGAGAGKLGDPRNL